jgi:hypothetical protein
VEPGAGNGEGRTSDHDESVKEREEDSAEKEGSHRASLVSSH